MQVLAKGYLLRPRGVRQGRLSEPASAMGPAGAFGKGNGPDSPAATPATQAAEFAQAAELCAYNAGVCEGAGAGHLALVWRMVGAFLAPVGELAAEGGWESEESDDGGSWLEDDLSDGDGDLAFHGSSYDDDDDDDDDNDDDFDDDEEEDEEGGDDEEVVERGGVEGAEGSKELKGFVLSRNRATSLVEPPQVGVLRGARKFSRDSGGGRCRRLGKAFAPLAGSPSGSRGLVSTGAALALLGGAGEGAMLAAAGRGRLGSGLGRGRLGSGLGPDLGPGLVPGGGGHGGRDSGCRGVGGDGGGSRRAVRVGSMASSGRSTPRSAPRSPSAAFHDHPLGPAHTPHTPGGRPGGRPLANNSTPCGRPSAEATGPMCVPPLFQETVSDPEVSVEPCFSCLELPSESMWVNTNRAPPRSASCSQSDATPATRRHVSPSVRLVWGKNRKHIGVLA